MTGINSPELQRAIAAGVQTALFATEAHWRPQRIVGNMLGGLR